MRLSWRDFANGLQAPGLDSIRTVEDAAGTPLDLYNRRIDQVLDNLLDSLPPASVRALELMAVGSNNRITLEALYCLLGADSTLKMDVMPGYEGRAAQYYIDELLDNELVSGRTDVAIPAAVVGMHEILQRKIHDNLDKSPGGARRFLHHVWRTLWNLARTGTDFTPPMMRANPLGWLNQYYQGIWLVFEALYLHGYIDNARLRYNGWNEACMLTGVRAREADGRPELTACGVTYRLAEPGPHPFLTSNEVRRAGRGSEGVRGRQSGPGPIRPERIAGRLRVGPGPSGPAVGVAAGAGPGPGGASGDPAPTRPRPSGRRGATAAGPAGCVTRPRRGAVPPVRLAPTGGRIAGTVRGEGGRPGMGKGSGLDIPRSTGKPRDAFT